MKLTEKQIETLVSMSKETDNLIEQEQKHYEKQILKENKNK